VGEVKYLTEGETMRRHLMIIALTVVGLLVLAVVPALVYAQGVRSMTDFRGSSDYSADDISRALFGRGEEKGAKALGREERTPRGVPEREEPNRSVAPNVYFEFNSDKVQPKYYPDLDKLGKALEQHPEYRIRIEGHTDNIGSDPYNQALSERRAESVRRYLVQKFAVASERLIAKGYGKSDRYDNSTPEGREKNRRIEVVNLGR
jgi:outer membrane protein OmpA-like peptidoglycan-associated protein